MTDNRLEHCFNVDVTYLDPMLPIDVPAISTDSATSYHGDSYLLRAHAWPRIFYLATISNRAEDILLDGGLAWHYSREARGADAFPVHDANHPRSNVDSPLILSNDPQLHRPVPDFSVIAAALGTQGASSSGDVQVTPGTGGAVILRPVIVTPAEYVAPLNFESAADRLQMSLWVPAERSARLQVLLDGNDLGTVDPSPTMRFGAYAGVNQVEFRFGRVVSAGMHTLTLRAIVGDGASEGVLGVGPLTIHRAAASTPAPVTGPKPTAIVATRVRRRRAARGKVTATVTLTFDGVVILRRGAITAREAKGRALPLSPTVQKKKGRTIVTVRVVGKAPLSLRIDGARMRDARKHAVDPDGDGAAGGVKVLAIR